MQKPPMVTDYRGHHRTLFPVREINLKAYADAILTQITWPALGIEPSMLSHEDRAAYALRLKIRDHPAHT